MPLLTDPTEASWTPEGAELASDTRRRIQVIACPDDDDQPLFDESIFDDIKLRSYDRELLESVITSLQQAVLVCDTPKVPVSGTGPLTPAGATYAGCTGWSRQAMSRAAFDIQMVLDHYA